MLRGSQRMSATLPTYKVSSRIEQRALNDTFEICHIGVKLQSEIGEVGNP